MKEKILTITNQTDWTLIKDQDNIKMMQFQNGGNKINVYWGTMTLSVLYKNQLPRQFYDVDLDTLRAMFGIKKQNIFQKFISIFK